MKSSANRSTWHNLLWLAALVWMITGCSAPVEATVPVVETPTQALTPQVNPTPTVAVTPTQAVPAHLILWVPPQFDPAAQGQAGQLIAARLSVFEAQNPGVTVEVRVKAPSGPGGLLEGLTAARAAAPLAAPSVVLLPRSDLESAAIKDLVLPLDRLQNVIEDTDWYPFARQMASIQGTLYGLPLCGEVLLTVYRPSQVEDLLKLDAGLEGILSWTTLSAHSSVVIFPAAAPQALVILSLYRSLGGEVADANGRPALQAAPLQQVYETFSQGVLYGAFPAWITALENDAQAWQSFKEGRGHLIITSSSSFLQNLPADAVAVPFSAMRAEPFTLADGWVVAVSDPFSERQELSEKLAVFLTQSDFMAAWSEAAGVLPARPSAMAAWKNQTLVAVLNQSAISAELRPDLTVLNSITPVLRESALDVLKQKLAPLDAADQAVQRLIIPNE